MTFIRTIALCIIAVFLASCKGDGNDVSERSDVVASVGRKALTTGELQRQVPTGLSPEDSVRFAKAYVRQWIDDNVVGELAALNIDDMKPIDAKVEVYRNELIMNEYRRLMYETHGATTITDDTLRSYYNSHREQFVLAEPMVKGVLAVVARNHPNYSDIRKAMIKPTADNLDHLDKLQIENDEAGDDSQPRLRLQHFRTSWVDWPSVTMRMPLSFNQPNPAKRLYESTLNGVTYLLNVEDVIPKGAIAPFDTVKEQVRNYLLAVNRLDYDRQLRDELFAKGIENGKIKLNIEIEIPTDK